MGGQKVSSTNILPFAMQCNITTRIVPKSMQLYKLYSQNNLTVQVHLNCIASYVFLFSTLRKFSLLIVTSKESKNHFNTGSPQSGQTDNLSHQMHLVRGTTYSFPQSQDHLDQ